MRFNLPGVCDDLFHAFNHIDKSYWDGIYYWYINGYNGRFANAFFMLWPGRPFMSEMFTKIFPAVMMFLIYAGIVYLFRSVNPKKWWDNLLYSLILLSFFYAYVPDIHQFYWYSGATVYIFPLIFYLFLLGIFIRYFNKKQNAFYIIASAVLLIFIIGSHEVWMILTMLTIVLFFLNCILKGEKLKKHSYFLLVLSIVFVLFVLLAPGTGNRIYNEGDYSDNMNFMGAFFISFFHTGKFLISWFFNLGTILMLLGILMISKNKKRNFFPLSRYSNIFLFLLVIFIVYIGVFVLLYSLGHTNHELRLRGLVPSFFVATILLLFIISTLGNRMVVKQISEKLNNNLGYFFLFIGFFFSVTTSANVKNAYWDIYSGNAEKEYKEQVWVRNYIKNSSGDKLYIPQLNRNTKTLFLFEIPNVESSFLHWVTSYYYGKNIIVNRSMSIDDFIEINTFSKDNNTAGIINKDSPYSYIHEVSASDLLQSPKRTIHLKAIVKHKNNVMPNARLVISNENYLHETPVKNILKNDTVVSFRWFFKRDELKNHEKFNIYLYNEDEEILEVECINMEIK
jgi:hypothetical protein